MPLDTTCPITVTLALADVAVVTQISPLTTGTGVTPIAIGPASAKRDVAAGGDDVQGCTTMLAAADVVADTRTSTPVVADETAPTPPTLIFVVDPATSDDADVPLNTTTGSINCHRPEP